MPKRKDAPHGPGDLMAAILLGNLLSGASAEEALAKATGSVEVALETSESADELRLVSMPDWVDAEPWPVEKPPLK